jgi:hypothetical protein
VPGLCQRGSATQRHLTEPAPAIDRGKVVADDSIAHLRSLMALPTLEAIFAQLAVEQDTAAVSRKSRTSSRADDEETAASRSLTLFSPKCARREGYREALSDRS